MRLDLKRSASATRDATRAVRDLLTEVGAFAMLHDATLAVTELVTSVVVRSSRACELLASFSGDRDRLRVELIGCEFVATPGVPMPSPPRASMFPVVAALATEWGIETTDSGDLVWFEMLRCSVSDVPV